MHFRIHPLFLICTREFFAFVFVCFECEFLLSIFPHWFEFSWGQLHLFSNEMVASSWETPSYLWCNKPCKNAETHRQESAVCVYVCVLYSKFKHKEYSHIIRKGFRLFAIDALPLLMQCQGKSVNSTSVQLLGSTIKDICTKKRKKMRNEKEFFEWKFSMQKRERLVKYGKTQRKEKIGTIHWRCESMTTNVSFVHFRNFPIQVVRRKWQW